MASSQYPAALAPKEEDIQKLLATQAHIGTKNLDPAMERYTWSRRLDGVHIFDLQKTWEKLLLAARVIASIEHPQDICVISGRPYGQRAVLKFAHFTGASSLAGRYTPGTFTNQIQARFLEPRLLILSDPRTDHQPLKESSYVNIPTIAFCNSDSPLQHVDIAIPCNNKSKHALGLMYWLLCREVLYLKNAIPRGTQWDVMPDLFFYRDPSEEEVKEETNAGQAFDATANATPSGEGWGNAPESQSWEAAPSAAAPSDNWNEGSVPTGQSWDAEH